MGYYVCIYRAYRSDDAMLADEACADDFPRSLGQQGPSMARSKASCYPKLPYISVLVTPAEPREHKLS